MPECSATYSTVRPGWPCSARPGERIGIVGEDEPTTHLDGAALDWLESTLRPHPGTVIAVSHDRIFLEQVATAVLEVDADRRTVVRYGGGYEGFRAEAHWPGAPVVVSHDRLLRRRFTGDIRRMESGRLLE